ncbi:MAG: hypothetical protein R2824_27395 [Saprospiraceae bacterium]|nr:hypothetical protein [Lewinella sp.]
MNNKLPANSDGCLSILQDGQVMMGITVQQMVFDNRTGNIKLLRTDYDELE